jgi:hypothetical protein
MSDIAPLIQAIIDGTKEMFLSQEMPVTNDPPAAVPAGSTHGRVISLLTYQNSIGGGFCFKCSLEFAGILCNKMLGQEGVDAEMLLDTVAEMLKLDLRRDQTPLRTGTTDHHLHSDGLLAT